MPDLVWHVPCPSCEEGVVRVRQHPTRSEIDALLPASMVSMRAVGAAADESPRFDGEAACSECGYDASSVAEKLEKEGVPDGAKSMPG
ncbi:MAG: hypothetical protein DRJ42_18285 [Deltaproteobacteria bacterium]|nr:MAG: hypothetical protein DRJ42_18285 [Deltaproteobacteria bacterium]